MKHLTYSPPPFIFVEGKKKSGMTSLSREPGIPPYIPELPVPHENVMNYNQTVLGIRGGQKISLFLLLANQRIFFSLSLSLSSITSLLSFFPSHHISQPQPLPLSLFSVLQVLPPCLPFTLVSPTFYIYVFCLIGYKF